MQRCKAVQHRARNCIWRIPHLGSTVVRGPRYVRVVHTQYLGQGRGEDRGRGKDRGRGRTGAGAAAGEPSAAPQCVNLMSRILITIKVNNGAFCNLCACNYTAIEYHGPRGGKYSY
jgi:hypothetical protein